MNFQGVVFAEMKQDENGAYYSSVVDFLTENSRTAVVSFMTDYSQLPPEPNLEPFHVVTDEQTFLDIDADPDMYVDYYEPVVGQGNG